MRLCHGLNVSSLRVRISVDSLKLTLIKDSTVKETACSKIVLNNDMDFLESEPQASDLNIPLRHCGCFLWLITRILHLQPAIACTG